MLFLSFLYYHEFYLEYEFYSSNFQKRKLAIPLQPDEMDTHVSVEYFRYSFEKRKGFHLAALLALDNRYRLTLFVIIILMSIIRMIPNIDCITFDANIFEYIT
jgi:hypothetical protein